MLTRNELFAILAIARLIEAKKRQPHGLDIERQLARTGHVVNQGALYDTLTRLKGRGLIHSRRGRRKTSGGKAPLYWWIDDEGMKECARFFVTLDLLRYGELKPIRFPATYGARHKFEVEAVCRMFNVPPFMVEDGNR